MNNCHKINFKDSGLYIDSPDWLKKATINPKNNDVRVTEVFNVRHQLRLIMKKLEKTLEEYGKFILL